MIDRESFKRAIDKCRSVDFDIDQALDRCIKVGKRINGVGVPREKKGKIHFDYEEEEKAKRIIEEMVADGEKVQSIADNLNFLGIKTLTGCDHTHSSVTRLKRKVFSIY